MRDYAIIAAAVAFAAFHSGSETGTYCMNRLRLRLRVEKGQASARLLQTFLARPTLAISTMLVGTNLGVYAATVFCTHKLREVGWAGRAALVSSLIMPPLLLIFADFLPKSFFQHHADRLMYRAIWPLQASKAVFYPFTAVLRAISALPRMLFGVREVPRRAVFTPEAFRFYIGESAAQGILSTFQRTMAENILRLKSLDLASVMTPLADVVMVEEQTPAGDALALMRTHRYSRMPVCRGTRDQVVGVVNVLDLAAPPEGPGPVGDLMRGALPLPRGTSVADALWTLRQARRQLAVVADATGSAVGIVTVKDLVEEIVGELEAW